MTALEKYTRLEGPGVWKAGPQAQRRDVVVELGEASLILKDTLSGVVVTHWSLPAVRRLTRGNRPAVFGPGEGEDGETLELDDSLLIEALDTIGAALAPRQPLRRLRLALAGLAILALGAAAWWVPGALVARTAGIVPPAMRAQIGREALDGLTLSAGGARLCADPHGRQALATLRTRVLGSDWRIAVVAGVPGLVTAALPGQVLVLGADLVEGLDSADALAGWLLAEALAVEARDPLLDALTWAGMRATLALLTTGTLPAHALDGYAASRLARAPASADPAALGARLEALGLSATPYALSLPASAAPLAEALADRPSGARAAQPLLSDGQWLTLQAICQ